MSEDIQKFLVKFLIAFFTAVAVDLRKWRASGKKWDWKAAIEAWIIGEIMGLTAGEATS